MTAAPMPHDAPATSPDSHATAHRAARRHAADVGRAILFYDGDCGFCARTVQFILRHERRRHTLRFATLQGASAAALRAHHPELANVDSVVWYQAAAAGHAERLLVRSDAGLAVLVYIGGIWRFLAGAGRLVPRFLRDAVYDAIARRRKRLARNATCLVPTPEQRARFIE